MQLLKQIKYRKLEVSENPLLGLEMGTNSIAGDPWYNS